ncbi:CHASE2 domain-containing protein [Leptolyngbyaceae cyanobacterium CCMR0082]|uniref:non-specific serine/threonine protein kinase n=2 Tax=Adonisia turfae TaxID=2950184 RepID=A0A6M0S9V8_9CYAN|nr:CHASE2 domain-containing protein [Adonisia turfae]MDV3353690.1 CHASE2 domain-containing protein [Leptothoe sp. LEGE 181152]NEZ56675.1 CHASE2 domain-containing protein [Adonisia turfae CCMR0081]NEZ64853.1 CHASE2 domain-containing protein [Adonisia turfae CCMR0082]
MLDNGTRNYPNAAEDLLQQAVQGLLKLMLGQVLKERYQLVRVLGAGGFGQTYVARDLFQPQTPECVVKQLKPASNDATFLKVARRLFDTEVSTLRRLGTHSCIPKLLDSFEEQQEFYLVQELIDGESLGDEIRRAGRLSEDQIITLLQETLGILKFVHDNRVIHRDLKPDNLIRRKSDNKLCLIDFGAVKEIRTQLVNSELTSLTVGVGTQGYTPSEQLAGKPRLSSDIFALGMTAIHALTGRAPTDLPDDMSSLELRWEEYANISPGLKYLLKKMVRHYFYQRYQSVAEVLYDLGHLDELAEKADQLTVAETFLPQATVWQPSRKESIRAVAIATAVTSVLILGFRQLQAFVPLELQVYDGLVAYQRDLGPDPRILLVGINEQDLNNQQRDSPSDQSIADALEIIQSHQPATIGLDLHRNFPIGEGRAALARSLTADNIIGITKLGDFQGERIPPPPELRPEQVSFNDFPLDPDGKIRRNLLYASLSTDEDAEVHISFGLLVAMHYLEKQHGLQPAPGDREDEFLKLGDTGFKLMNSTFGGYQSVDAAGYQIPITYRSPTQLAQRVSLTDILTDAVDPELITNKVVLIGTTAYTSTDKFFTPYTLRSDISDENYLMSGVEVHLHMVSQFLSAVLDDYPLPWAWPDGAEIAWIIVWASGGSWLTWQLRKRRYLLLAYGIGVVAIAGTTVLFFLTNAWVPVVAPLAAFTVASGSLLAYRRYRQRYPRLR